VTPIAGGNWVKYAVALSAPAGPGFAVPYTFSMASAGPYTQLSGAYDWDARLTSSGKARAAKQVDSLSSAVTARLPHSLAGVPSALVVRWRAGLLDCR